MGIYVGDKRYAPYIGDKRREVRNKKALPYDAEVEYLESTGTQYIDLGFKATREIDIEISINRSSNSIRWDCGAEDGWSSKIARFIIINNDQAYWRFYNGGNGIVQSQNAVGDIRIIGNKYVGTIINETTGINYSRTSPYSQNFQTSGNFLLFAMNFVGEPSVDGTSSGARIYNAKVRDTGVNLDLIPVRVGQVGYLYDRVSGNLFGNSGTGDFIIGSDKT